MNRREFLATVPAITLSGVAVKGLNTTRNGLPVAEFRGGEIVNVPYLIKSLKYKEYTHGCRKENCVACSGGRFSGLIWVKEKDAIDCPHFQGFGFRFFWGELELWMTDAYACVDLWGPPHRFMLKRIALTDEHRYDLGISKEQYSAIREKIRQQQWLCPTT